MPPSSSTRPTFFWQPGVNPFVGAVAPQVGAYGINQNFKMPYAETSYSAQPRTAAHQSSTLVTLGYVGTGGQPPRGPLQDINQPVANGTTKASSHLSTPAAYPYLQTSYPQREPRVRGQGPARHQPAELRRQLQLQLAPGHGPSGRLEGLSGPRFNYTLSASRSTTPPPTPRP